MHWVNPKDRNVLDNTLSATCMSAFAKTDMRGPVSQAAHADSRSRNLVGSRFLLVYQAASFTLFNGGVARNEIAARFQALIAITAAVRSTSSFSEKWWRASSYTSSGT